jgi:hypothetical protein
MFEKTITVRLTEAIQKTLFENHFANSHVTIAKDCQDLGEVPAGFRDLPEPVSGRSDGNVELKKGRERSGRRTKTVCRQTGPGLPA